MTNIPTQASGWPVVGNARSIKMLRAALRTGNLPHAFLLAGPEGTGKRAFALAFAMALNCQGAIPEGQLWPDAPCGLCASCLKIGRGAHPDLMEINLEKQAQAQGEVAGKSRTGPAKELKIDIIRDMQATIGLSPHSARWKVYIVGDAEKLNEEASNCLLKTLEEPPDRTIIMLLAPDEESMLPTISSRCFTVPVRPLAARAVAEALEDYWGVERDQAGVLAAISGGRMGFAVRLLEDRESMARRRRALEAMTVLAGSTISDRVTTATQLAKMFTDARPELYEMLDVWESWWRDVMVVAASSQQLAINIDHLQTLKSVAGKNSANVACRAVLLIQETRQQLLENVNPRLALEALTLGLP